MLWQTIHWQISCMLIAMVTSNHITERKIKMALQVASAVQLTSPSIMCNLTPRMVNNIMLELDHLGQTTKLEFAEISRADSIIYCLNDNASLQKANNLLLSGNMLLIVGSEDDIAVARHVLSIGIGDLVYFLDIQTGRLTETYTVNDRIVKNVLGHFSTNFGFVWIESKDILTRRSNFHGLPMKVCSYAIGAPFMHYPNKVREGFNWIKDRKESLIADVTEVTGYGSFIEVMRMLQQELNFTTSMIVRKDDSFGYPRFVNGTFVGYTGMIGDLLSRDIDVIMAPIQHIYERYGILEFFHGIGTITISLLVNADAGNEEQEWLTYLLPFQTHLWLLLLANSLCATLAISLVRFLYSPHVPSCLSLISESMGNFWMVTMSYFGKPSSTQVWWTVRSTKVLLLVIFLSGNLVFMFYKAGLTSELSVKRQILPFSTAKGLYDSKYRVIHIWSQIDSMFRLFGHYPNMYWISKSYYERDHSNSFYKSYEDTLEALASPYSQTALFSFVEKFYAFPEYKCLISVAWRRPTSTPLTMAMHKGSPYHKIMNFVYLKKIDSGFLSRIARRLYGKVDVPCPITVKGTSLGPFKVLGAYMTYSFGVGLSLLLLVLEVTWKQMNKRFTGNNDILESDLVIHAKDFEHILGKFCRTWGPLPTQPRYQSMFLSELRDLLSSN